MIVRPITSFDIEPTVEALLSAFRGDPIIVFLFGHGWEEKAHVAEFFRILLDVRVTLGMPAFCAEDDGQIVGAVMGYNTSRPGWNKIQVGKWSALMRAVDGLELRLGAYGELAEKFEPAERHFYLGVIGVKEGKKGSGVGGALLARFCEASSKDEESCGVYLDTACEASLRFYLRNGFKLRGEGILAKGTSLWCVFKATGSGAAAYR